MSTRDPAELLVFLYGPVKGSWDRLAVKWETVVQRASLRDNGKMPRFEGEGVTTYKLHNIQLHKSYRHK